MGYFLQTYASNSLLHFVAGDEFLRIEGGRALKRIECKKKIGKNYVSRQHKKGTFAPPPCLCSSRVEGALPVSLAVVVPILLEFFTKLNYFLSS